MSCKKDEEFDGISETESATSSNAIPLDQFAVNDSTDYSIQTFCDVEGENREDNGVIVIVEDVK